MDPLADKPPLELLRETQERLRLALEASNDGIWDWDIPSGHLFVSDRWQTMLGYAVGEFVPGIEAWEHTCHPDDLPEAKRRLQAHLDQQSDHYELEHRLRCKDGRWLWVLGRGRVVKRDANGQALRMVGTNTDISERKQQEAALRMADERWLAALEGTGAGVWDWNIPAGTVFFSRLWKSMLGFQEHEVGDQLHEWSDRVHPDDMPQVMADVQRHFAGETESYTNEHRVRCKDGSYKWIYDQGKVMERDAAGQPIRMIGTHTDISQLKVQQAALQQAEERWQFALEGAGAGVWDWDIVNGTTFHSVRWKTMLGYAEHDIQPPISEWESRLHPADRANVMTILQAHLQGETELYESQHRMRCKDGSYKWVLDRGMVTARDANGKALRMIGTHTDIDAQKRAELAVQASERRLRQIAETFPGVIYQFHVLLNGEVELRYISPRLSELFGLPVGQPAPSYRLLLEHLHADDLPRQLAQFADAVRTQQPYQFEGRLLHPDGRELWIEDRAVPSRDEDGLNYCGVILDISRRKKLERVKDEFLSTVSHELRTPLTSILGSLRLLGSGVAGALPDKAGQLIELALRNSDRLLILIGDLLDVAQLESGALRLRMGRHGLNELVVDAVEASRPLAERHHLRLELRLPADVQYAQVDPIRLVQILGNLLSNACKYAPPNSVVLASMSVAAGKATLSIIDQGPGIPAAFHSQIFQKFSRADSSDQRTRGGTGLGLNICKALIESMGGEIGFHSEPNVRTEFFVRLSLA